MSDFVLDRALRNLRDRLRRLELAVARNRPATGTTYDNTSSGLTATEIQAALDELAALIGTGNFLEVINGGGETVFPLGTLGPTEAVNLVNGNWQHGTLDQDCTLTFATIADTAGRWLLLELAEDGTGGWGPTWPGSVVWLGGSAPNHDTTAGTTTMYLFGTRNGGTFWVGGQLGAGVSFATPAIVLGTAAAAGAAATTIRSDATIVAFDATVPTTQAFGDSAATGVAAVAARRDHKHAMPANPVTEAAVRDIGRWEPVVTDGELLLMDDDVVMMWIGG